MAKTTTTKNTSKEATKPTKSKGSKSKTAKSKKSLPKKEEAVVLIYANWCPHCQTMKPEWNEMKNRLGSGIEIIEIEDSDFDKDVKISNIENTKLNGEKIEVYGYPTMLKIHDGRAEYYGGSRNFTDMYNWVTNKNKIGGYSKSKIRKQTRSKSIKKSIS